MADGSTGEAAGRTGEATLAETLVAELRADEVEESTREALREQLGGGSTSEVHVQRLAAKVSELEAYTEAIESFLDDAGTAEEISAELETLREETLTEADVESLSDEIAGLRSDLEAVEERLDQFERWRTDLAGALLDEQP